MTDDLGYQVRPARTDDTHAVVGLSKLWAEEGCTTGYVALKDDEHLQSWLDGGYFFVGGHV